MWSGGILNLFGKGKPFRWPSVRPASTDECPWRFEGAPCTSGICPGLQNPKSKGNCKNFWMMELQELALQDENSTDLQGEWNMFGAWSLEELTISKVVIIQRSPGRISNFQEFVHFWNNNFQCPINTPICHVSTCRSRDLQCVPGPGEGLRGHRLTEPQK